MPRAPCARRHQHPAPGAQRRGVPLACHPGIGSPGRDRRGREEARLIYLGVSHMSPEPEGRRFVIDIGGGSTACVIGERFDPDLAAPACTWAASARRAVLLERKTRRPELRARRLAAALELASLRESFRELGWSRASGSSGTILAVSEVLRINGWSHGEIHLDALRRLVEAIQERETLDELSLPGLEEDRAAVFPGGVAILVAAFEQLGIEVLEPRTERCARESSTSCSTGRRTRTRATAASRPLRRATRSMSRRRSAWRKPRSPSRTSARRLEARCRARPPRARVGGSRARDRPRGRLLRLSEAQRLHPRARRHARILSRGPGAAGGGGGRAPAQALARAVRGRLRRERRGLALRLALLLRLAVRLHHSRSRERLPKVQLRAGQATLTLVFPRGWLEARPLTRADLAEEAEHFAEVGFRLRFPTATRS